MNKKEKKSEIGCNHRNFLMCKESVNFGIPYYFLSQLLYISNLKDLNKLKESVQYANWRSTDHRNPTHTKQYRLLSITLHYKKLPFGINLTWMGITLTTPLPVPRTSSSVSLLPPLRNEPPVPMVTKSANDWPPV